MTSLIFRTAAIASVVAACVIGPAAQARVVLSYSLSGVVLQADSRAPLDGVRIVASQLLRGMPTGYEHRIEERTATSDASGRFTIDSLQSGALSLVLSKPGYSTIRCDLDLEKKTGQLTFLMRPSSAR